MEGYLGTVLPMAITFAPRNFSDCKGQLLNIQQYAALYALIGTAYGGDARTTFALPNLQGRFPLGIGTTPNTSNTFSLGATGGSSSATLNISNIPPHTHPASASVAMSGMTVTLPSFNASAATTTTLKASSAAGNAANPANNSYLAGVKADYGGDAVNANVYASSAPASTVTLGGVSSTTNVTVTPAGTAGVSGAAAASVTVGPTGAGAPFSSMPPYTALRFVICVTGLFPARN
jgi:microcystin-dependent protein